VPQSFQPGGRAPAPPPLDLVQDFVNTEIPEWARDDIATPELLEDWLRQRGLLEVGTSVMAADFVAARELRAAVRGLALVNTLGALPNDELRASLASALSAVSLRVEVDEGGRLVPRPAGVGAGRALASIVAIVLESQASGSWGRLKACRKESCRWLFYDGSRNRSSSWCSMSICGNRAKTAEYRRRRAATS
jgi:predicted RNA-binding Zn ribbon-like protein